MFKPGQSQDNFLNGKMYSNTAYKDDTYLPSKKERLFSTSAVNLELPNADSAICYNLLLLVCKEITLIVHWDLH